MKDADPTIAVSKFKATCLSVIADVKRTRQPVTVTRFGKPVARVVPAEAPPKGRRILGAYRGQIRITGDIVSPVLPASAWDALRK